MPQNEKRRLSGLEKAAVIVLSLPPEQVSKVFEILSAEEIKLLSTTMSALGTVHSSQVENVFVNFVNEISSTDTLIGSIESTEKILIEVLGSKRAEEIMDEVRGPSGKTLWEKLANVNEDLLAGYLKNEHPQTIAIILSNLKPENAASVINLLPDQLATDVCHRMIKMDTVHHDFIKELEEVLYKDFMKNLVRSSRRNNYEVLVDILNHVDRSAEKKILDNLEGIDPEATERVRELMFTFEDVLGLGDQAIKILLSNIDKRKLALAMKGLVEHQRMIFLQNMSERARKLLLDDIQQMGAVRIKDVEEAQNYIVNTTKQLAQNEQIILVDPRDTGSQLIG